VFYAIFELNPQSYPQELWKSFFLDKWNICAKNIYPICVASTD